MPLTFARRSLYVTPLGLGVGDFLIFADRGSSITWLMIGLFPFQVSGYFLIST
jgi:hypothetical protein